MEICSGNAGGTTRATVAPNKSNICGLVYSVTISGSLWLLLELLPDFSWCQAVVVPEIDQPSNRFRRSSIFLPSQ